MQRSFLTSDGTQISYDIHHGELRPWLVFVHGAGGDRTAWQHERERLHRDGYATLALDLRGHGTSSRPADAAAYTLDRFSADIHELLHRERIEQFVLIGHCFGGVVATMFHRQHPMGARGYVLIDTTDRSPAVVAAMLDHGWARWLVGEIVAHPTLAAHAFGHVNFDHYAHTGDWNWPRIASDLAHTSLASWLATYEALAGFDGRKILQTITQPVLVIEGANDSIFPLKVAEEVASEIPGSDLELIPDQNHIVVLADPHDIAAAIDEFASALPDHHSI